MFIIKWLRPDNSYYYKYSQYYMFSKIGDKNQYGHEIIDINYIYNNKIWTFEEYISRKCYKEHENIKDILIDKTISMLTKLKKQ